MLARLKPLCLTAMLWLGASITHAQVPEQTPENAQRFISATMPTRMEAGSPNDVRRIATVRLSTPTWSTDYCTTSFHARFELLSDGGFEHPIRWAEIAEVQHREQDLTVTIVKADGHQTSYYFRYDAVSRAARAAYAMEFLRQHCDPAAGTGF